MVLIGLFLIGFLLGGVLAGLLAEKIWGVSLQSFVSQTPYTKPQIEALKFINIFSSISGFGLTSLVFLQRYAPGNIQSYLKLNKGIPIAVGLLIPLLAIFSSPFIDWIHQWNQSLPFEGNAEEMARKTRALTASFLNSENHIDLIFNIIWLAVFPALLEELLFRGTLQPFLHDRIQNLHLAIWISAILFSLLHQDLPAFFPRMLMGVFLGYLVVWTGSLWSSIAAHGINNAMVVYLVYLEKNQNLPSYIHADGNWPWELVLGSLGLTLLTLALIYQFSRKHNAQFDV